MANKSEKPVPEGQDSFFGPGFTMARPEDSLNCKGKLGRGTRKRSEAVAPKGRMVGTQTVADQRTRDEKFEDATKGRSDLRLDE